MNNRGVAILLLSAIGLLVAIILFFSTTDKIHVVGNSTFLGEVEAQVLDTYLEGENLMVFLETAARMSVGTEDFGVSFSGYLSKANRVFGLDLKIADFEFVTDETSMRAICSRGFVIESGPVRYTVVPSFIIYL
ncbi:MAG: hypothetical protein V1914_04360 [archaeon]